MASLDFDSYIILIFSILSSDSCWDTITDTNLSWLTYLQTNPTYWHLAGVMESVAFIAKPGKKSRWLMLERLELSDGFQGRVLKEKMRERVVEYMNSLCIILWLVDGEVKAWCQTG